MDYSLVSCKLKFRPFFSEYVVESDLEFLLIVKSKLGDRMVKHLLNLFTAKYGDLSVSCSPRYFVQPRIININFNQFSVEIFCLL